MRVRAIGKALKYGLLPSRFYEDECHYDCSYLAHLRMNLAYALRWATFSEDAEDRAFERAVSPPPGFRINASWPRRILYSLIGRQH